MTRDEVIESIHNHPDFYHRLDTCPKFKETMIPLEGIEELISLSSRADTTSPRQTQMYNTLVRANIFCSGACRRYVARMMDLVNSVMTTGWDWKKPEILWLPKIPQINGLRRSALMLHLTGEVWGRDGMKERSVWTK